MRWRTPVIYLCIQERLKKESRMGVIAKEKTQIIIGRIYHLSKKMVGMVEKELLELKLIKDFGKDYYFINNNSPKTFQIILEYY